MGTTIQTPAFAGQRGAASDDSGRYTCFDCGRQWQSGERYVYWPVSFRIARSGWTRWSWHGFQIGWDDIEKRVFGHTIRIGPFAIVFGSGRRVTPRPSGCEFCDTSEVQR